MVHIKTNKKNFNYDSNTKMIETDSNAKDSCLADYSWLFLSGYWPVLLAFLIAYMHMLLEFSFELAITFYVRILSFINELNKILDILDLCKNWFYFLKNILQHPLSEFGTSSEN